MNQPIDDGGPAFPFDELCQRTGGVFAQHHGMTLRAYLAGQALSWPIWAEKGTPSEVASSCLKHADALIAALNGKVDA